MTAIAQDESVSTATARLSNPKYEIPPEVARHASTGIMSPKELPDYVVYGLPADAVMHELPDLDITKPAPKPKKKKKKKQPPAPDPSFWWAETEMWAPKTWQFENQADGIHFYGATDRRSSDRYWGSFGVTALYGLGPDRLPNPGGQWWRSTPYVELFGEIHGWTHIVSLFDKDGWSKCSLNLTQELYQFIPFSLNPDAPQVVGKATTTQVLANSLTGTVSLEDAYLPGFTWMPPVTFSVANFNPAVELWAKLTVEFAFYLRAGAIHSGPDALNPLPSHPVLVRGFQWPLTPL